MACPFARAQVDDDKWIICTPYFNIHLQDFQSQDFQASRNFAAGRTASPGICARDFYDCDAHLAGGALAAILQECGQEAQGEYQRPRLPYPCVAPIVPAGPGPAALPIGAPPGGPAAAVVPASEKGPAPVGAAVPAVALAGAPGPAVGLGALGLAPGLGPAGPAPAAPLPGGPAGTAVPAASAGAAIDARVLSVKYI